jgi:hypothetical protein
MLTNVDSAFAGPGRFYKGNLHTHSSASDGARSPADVCALYREAGYDFLALTDHFLLRYGFPIVDTRPFRREGFTTILGAELHAPATAAGETWHLLAVGLPLDFSPPAPDETASALAARSVAAGAFLAIPHPAWYALTVDDAMTIAGAHAVEVYNHTSAVRTARGDGMYLLDQLLARGLPVQACATDDAHLHCDDAFGGWVMVKAIANEPDALLDSLKAGRYYSTQGPLIEGIEWSAETVTVRCTPAAAVMVLGRGSRAEQSLKAGQTCASLPLERLRSGRFARIVVIDGDGRRAWSNPVRLDGFPPPAPVTQG